MSQTLHSFPKNALEEVRASLTEYKGKQYSFPFKTDSDGVGHGYRGLILTERPEARGE